VRCDAPPKVAASISSAHLIRAQAGRSLLGSLLQQGFEYQPQGFNLRLAGLAAGQQVTVDFGDWDGIPLWLPMTLR